MCSPSQPSQPTSTSQTTIPEYYKPTAERTIGRAEALSEAPYQAYGGQRIAESSPEQQAARASVAGMTGPTQFQTGTGLVGAGGYQGLGAGMQGMQAGQQGMQFGQNYMGMATDPRAQQAFMSPYVQNVLDVQKQEAIRDAQKTQLAANLGAARQGTYGGSRQLLAATERERNLGQNLANIEAQGMQSAYDRAQQAMQFGTTAGIQGAQAGIQGAQAAIQGGQAATQAGQALGQLGTAQQQAALQLAQAKEQFGGLGQMERQKALDQAYQDFITQQQHPYKQLGFLSDILRGSSNLTATGGKTVYEAPPSVLSQITGPGLLAYGAYKEFNRP